jgi:hypothetical protein
MRLSNLRSFVYWLPRAIGDYQAIRRGPRATSKRLARRAVGKATGRALRKLFR